MRSFWHSWAAMGRTGLGWNGQGRDSFARYGLSNDEAGLAWAGLSWAGWHIQGVPEKMTPLPKIPEKTTPVKTICTYRRSYILTFGNKSRQVRRLKKKARPLIPTSILTFRGHFFWDTKRGHFFWDTLYIEREYFSAGVECV